MNGPSDRARDTVRNLTRLAARGGTLVTAEQVVEAAHDRSLGLDRSVCLGDVVGFLCQAGFPDVADHITAQFGGVAADGF